MKMSTEKLMGLLVGLSLSTGILAEGSGNGYKPPSSPELYDVNEPIEPPYVRVKKIKSHAYLGLGGSFGSSYLAGGGGSNKASWNVVGEGGYVKALTTWTRVDLGLEFFNGAIGNSSNDLKINVAGLAKLGYGYNISENLYALVRVGYGLATGTYKNTDVDVGNKSVSGGVWQVGMQLLVPTESAVDVLGGIFFNQYSFGDKGTYNAIEGRLGLRFRI